MRQGALTLMRGLPLFEGVGDETLEALTYGALFQWYPREARLFAEGEIPDFLHVLVEGTAMLAGCDEAGQETVIDIVRPGDCFVPAAVLALNAGRAFRRREAAVLAEAAQTQTPLAFRGRFD